MVSGVARASVTGRTVIIPPAKLAAPIRNWRRFAWSSAMVMFRLRRAILRSFPRKRESERLECGNQVHGINL
jgi:hypothetical protein